MLKKVKVKTKTVTMIKARAVSGQTRAVGEVLRDLPETVADMLVGRKVAVLGEKTQQKPVEEKPEPKP
ncbi:hypothetical protein AB9F26_05150 [Falsihalocynthiibacter sp. BN13B15]|uniref:hypothetical protein n=1 Tax=Falsihalocynthiibacter sp. BN13B15 TaxID=3240871 RepID=UPI00350F43CC